MESPALPRIWRFSVTPCVARAASLLPGAESRAIHFHRDVGFDPSNCEAGLIPGRSVRLRICPRLLLFLALALPAFAQLQSANASGVSMGHLHFHADDLAPHVRFWTEVLGATPTKVGPLDVYRLPGVFIAMTKAKPTGDMETSTVPIVGFRVRDLAAILTKATAAEVRIVDRSDSGATLIGPDRIRVRLTADKKLEEAVVNDRIQIASPKPEQAAKWYADVFGAAAVESQATLPGVRLEFTETASPAGTKNRVLDHIGFEVKDLQAFTKALLARGVKVDLPYLKLPDLGIAIGFVTDPWGTYIELTEGLDKH